jgi:hypothetical protein
MFINLILLVIIILLIILICKLETEQEKFNGYVFAPSPPPPSCTPDNNCFQGHPVRFTMYENMCEPEGLDSRTCRVPRGEGLLRAPRQLKDTCIRGFDI